MASIQTRLFLLFDISIVYMTSLKARNGFIDYSDFCDKRLKTQLQIIVNKLEIILEEREKVSDLELWPLYQRYYQLWNQFFASNYQQRWTVSLINDDDDHWRFIYIHLKELVQNAHLLSYQIPDY
jgi:hypothetical protein